MGQALYRKYRSKKLSEVVGQEHITTTLENALKAGRISHAYLFTGPRGIGKTSIARILAHEVNQLPYEDDLSHIDIIEIDAASNRRIDEIRDLREKVHVAPVSAKYKVYIIDEVHMLTREAFNALLKTLEEPPEHVIFILATTEAHKLPETIISRTQRYNFKPVSVDKVVEHLRTIAKQEKIPITDEALSLIAEHGEGSFRDSISLLDQAGNAKDKIELEDIQAMLGIAPDEAIDTLFQAAVNHEPVKVTQQLQHMREQGYPPAAIAKQLGTKLRNTLSSGKAPLDPADITKTLHDLLKVPLAHEPETYLEIVLLDAALRGAGPDNPAPRSQPGSRPALKPDPAAEPVSTSAVAVNPQTAEKAEAKIVKPAAPAAKAAPIADEIELWAELLKTVREQQQTLYGVLRMAHANFAGGTLVLKFGFPFHQKRINEDKNRRLLQKVLHDLSGKQYDLEILYEAGLEQPHNPTITTTNAEPDDLSTISNIFGGAEVL